MVLHVNGTTPPGSVVAPKYLKAQVYLPPPLVDHHPELRPTIMCIVQQFIESIGVVTVRNWTSHAKTQLGYSLNQPGVCFPNGCIYDVPQPENGTSRYVFLGQPTGAFSTSTSTSPSPASLPASTAYSDDETVDPVILELLAAQDQNALLNAQILEQQSEIKNLEAQLEMLNVDNVPVARVHSPFQSTQFSPVRNATANFRALDISRTHHESPSPFLSRVCPISNKLSTSQRVYDPGPTCPGATHLGLSSPHRQTSQPFSPSKQKAEKSPASMVSTVLHNYGHDNLLDSVSLHAKFTDANVLDSELGRLGLSPQIVKEIITAIGIDNGLA